MKAIEVPEVSLKMVPTEIWVNDLREFKLQLWNGNEKRDECNVYSGIPGRQELIEPHLDYSGSLRPIPHGKYEIGPIEEAKSGSWGQSIGAYWIDLIPIDPQNDRSAFGIHLDANHYQPRGRGSAGCVVSPFQATIWRIMQWLRSKARPRYLYVDYTGFFESE